MNTQSEDIGCGIPSSPLDIIPYQTMSSMPCHHFPWETPRVRRSQAWYGIIALGQHTRSNYVGRGMPSLPLDNTDGRTTSGVSCYHHPWLADTVRRQRPLNCHHPNWTAHTIRLRRAWHDMMSLGQHTWSNDIDHGTVIIALSMHTRSNDVTLSMASSPLKSIHDRTMLGVVCYQCS